MNTPYIPDSTLKKILYELIHDDVEICGFLEVEEKGLVKLIFNNRGVKTDRGGGMCQHTQYTRYIYHTHPKMLKAFPSAEDILKVLKKRDKDYPKVSVIFTIWGIWELASNLRINIDPNWLDFFRQVINKDMIPLHKLNSRNKWETLTESIQQVIYDVNERPKKKFGKKIFDLKISFTPWENIKGDYYMKYF